MRGLTAQALEVHQMQVRFRQNMCIYIYIYIPYPPAYQGDPPLFSCFLQTEARETAWFGLIHSDKREV